MPSIEIRTAQHVLIDYTPATLQERFVGLLIDLIVVLFSLMALAFLILLTGATSQGLWMIWKVLAMGGMYIFYALFCESFLNGQTIGKRSQQTRVVRLDGKELGLSDLLLRSTLQLVDFYYTAGVVGALLISISGKRQRLGDMAAGTTVIKIGQGGRFKLTDILGIATLENYQPVYPQIRQLSEDDMLTIRNVIMRYEKYRNASHEAAVEELVERLSAVLEVRFEASRGTLSQVQFLKTLVKDYIVLTR